MNLKTHTGYSEIQISEMFNWELKGKAGQVRDP